MLQIALTLLAALLLGSIPTAHALARLLKDTDIRRSGSGNVGALNAYRQLGKRAGVFVLMLDTGKGALAVYLGMILDVPNGAVYGAAILATLGHNFVWSGDTGHSGTQFLPILEFPRWQRSGYGAGHIGGNEVVPKN